MVVVLVNDAIQAVLDDAGAAHVASRHTKHVHTVSHTNLASALRNLRHAPSLASLLASSELHLTHQHACDAHITHERNRELHARVQRLKARQRDAEYARMVRDVSRAHASNAQREALRMGRFAPQMSLAANVVITMATCFTAGYYVFSHSTGSQTGGLIGGVAAMIVAMGVEVVLVLTRMYTIDNELQRHDKQRRAAAQRAAPL